MSQRSSEYIIYNST